jgi:hypothetical protein
MSDKLNISNNLNTADSPKNSINETGTSILNSMFKDNQKTIIGSIDLIADVSNPKFERADRHNFVESNMNDESFPGTIRRSSIRD